MTAPFQGIFERANPGTGGHVSFAFSEPDLNQSAKRLLAHVDRILDRLHDKTQVSLGVIELDVEPGRFPDVLVAFFADPLWDYSTRFCIGAICKGEREEGYEVGRLVFEISPGHIGRLLALDTGLRWGAALRIGGFQVPESDVASAINGSPFDRDQAVRLEPLARFAWAASSDLNRLSIWASSGTPDVLDQVKALSP